MSYLFKNVLRLNDKAGTTANDNFQTKDWRLTGVSTLVTAAGLTNQGNLSDDGQLFISLTASNTQVAGRIYKVFDAGVASSLVATFTATNQTSAFATIAATNSSNLTGQVTVMYNTAIQIDNPIKLQVTFGTDADILLYEDPRQFQAWTPQHGLAPLHNDAAFEIIQYIAHKFREQLHGNAHSSGADGVNRSWPLFPNFFLSVSEPDISRVHNPQQLRRAASMFVMGLAYSRDFLGNTTDFDPHADRSRRYFDRYAQEISNLNLDIDLDKDGVIDDIVSAGGFEWGRS